MVYCNFLIQAKETPTEFTVFSVIAVASTLSFMAAPLCVPKSSSVLISRKNHLTSARYDRAAMFRIGRLGRAIQVEESA